MKKAFAVGLVSLAFSGALVAPAQALDEPVSTPCPVAIDGSDAEMVMRNEISALRANLAVVESHAASLEAQRDNDTLTIERLGKQVERKQATIKRLRAELRKR